jgi:hypothetical protein
MVSPAHTKYHANTLTGSGSSANGIITIEYGGGYTYAQPRTLRMM